jgi:hypothetical protein
MQTILAQPFGRLLLTTVGLGFVAFGPFATVQSRSAVCIPTASPNA